MSNINDFIVRLTTCMGSVVNEITVIGSDIMVEYGDTLYMISISKMADISYEEEGGPS